jgi:hypothetical protein
MLRLANLSPRWKAIGADGKPFGPDLPREDWQLVPSINKGWKTHPVARMWRGHEHALLRYQFAICDEWRWRGYRDTCLEKTRMVFDTAGFTREVLDPSWLGLEAVHASHRGRLLDKDPAFYSQWGWTDRVISEEEGYVWPV